MDTYRMKRVLTAFLSIGFIFAFSASSAFASNAGLSVSLVTPGEIDPGITQVNIQTTICVSGYSATIRPSSSYTTKLKKLQLATSYSFYHDLKTGDFEEDHLISLEIGGNPTSSLNLWPEAYAGVYGARLKDQLENKLHELVCSGQIALKVAQEAIALNWITAYGQYVEGASSPLPTATPTLSTTLNPAPTPSPMSHASTAPPPSNSPAQSVSAVITLTTPTSVTKGGDITLRAKTSTRDVCTLKVTLPSGRDSTSAGIGSATADDSGNMSWTWNVKSNTGAGIARIYVTCASGGSQSATFKIL